VEAVTLFETQLHLIASYRFLAWFSFFCVIYDNRRRNETETRWLSPLHGAAASWPRKLREIVTAKSEFQFSDASGQFIAQDFNIICIFHHIVL